MKKMFLLGSALLMSAAALAQNQVKDPYPGYNHNFNPDWSLMRKVMGDGGNTGISVKSSSQKQLPDHFNNADYSYFPPVFNQGGFGSCGVSSHVGYMMTSEMNCYDKTDASQLENQLPPMFQYPFTYNGPGKDDIAIDVGFPSAKLYGGRYVSTIYGAFECDKDDWGWVTGYPLFYNAMFHRISHAGNFPKNVGTPEGAAALKWYLYNHNGDPAYGGRGGIVCMGVGAGGSAQAVIGKTPTNDKIGVTGKSYLLHWNLDHPDHAMTIVGYDDRIQFDLDNNGKFGEAKNELGQNETGAWILVNSWGSGWANKGFIYCPYAMGGPVSVEHQMHGKKAYTLARNDYWYPYVYHYRGSYRPLRTVKALMSYIGRSEIAVKVGIAQDTTATQPEATYNFAYISYTGDGVNDGKDAKMPLLGRWADGKIHYEPMEFGIDVTDLSASYDTRKPLKYFLIVDSKATATGHGGIHKASMIDYEFNREGNEVPFTIKGDSVDIQNHGMQTMISLVLPGQAFNPPTNLAYSDNNLVWQSPKGSAYSPVSYDIYRNNVLVGQSTDTHFALSDNTGSYSVKAVYEMNGEKFWSVSSNVVGQKSPIREKEYDSDIVNFNNSGFVIPEIATKNRPNFTIEFWIQPKRLKNWNQMIGTKWGEYLIHANQDGAVTAGWNMGENRTTTSPGALAVGKWHHCAVVINRNKTSIYIDGNLRASTISHNYSGFPAIHNLVFGNDKGDDRLNGNLDEVRIWDSSRTGKEIKDNMSTPIADPINTPHLLAYYRMNVIKKWNASTNDSVAFLEDCAHGNDAYFVDTDWKEATIPAYLNYLRKNALKKVIVKLQAPEKVYTNEPIQPGLSTSVNAYKYEWKVENATPATSNIPNPTFVFNKAGKSQIIVKVTDMSETLVNADTITVNVLNSPTPSADFMLSSNVVAGGDRISFMPVNKAPGCKYTWEMPGAVVDNATTTLASATYTTAGEKTVTLIVTDSDGKEYKMSKTFNVLEAAPSANVDIDPVYVLKGHTVKLKDNSTYNPTEATWRFVSPYGDMVAKGLNTQLTPEVPGVYNLYYIASNRMGSSAFERGKALYVCNAESFNGLTIKGPRSLVTDLNAPSSEEFSIDFWFRPTDFEDNSNGIYAKGTNGKFSIVANASGDATFTAGNVSVTAPNFYILSEWHHYAITGSKYGTISFYRDGVKIFNKATRVKQDFGAMMKTIQLGRVKATDASMFASVDEFRVWNKVLREADLRKYAVAPIEKSEMEAAKKKGLILYYNFNQNSGNVKDEVSGEVKGIRSANYGPDGDAWIDSRGVFALSFNTKQYPNVADLGNKLDKSTYNVVSTSDEETVEGPAVAGYALDDNLASMWVTRSTNRLNYPHSITLTRANKDVIKAMSIIYSRNNNFRAGTVNIEQSDDQKIWTLVDYKYELSNTNSSGVVFSTPLMKKYIRLTFLSPMVEGQQVLAISEINLFGEPQKGETENRPLDYVSTTDQESGSLQGQGIHAVDGDEATLWYSRQNTPYSHSIVLKSAKSFDYVDFSFGTNQGAARMNVWESDNKKDWELLSENVRIPFYDKCSVALPQAVKKPYVKFEFTYSRNMELATMLGVREIKAAASKELITGIQDVQVNDEALKAAAANAIYDLQGRKVGHQLYNLPAGIYIYKGHKVMVK